MGLTMRQMIPAPTPTAPTGPSSAPGEEGWSRIDQGRGAAGEWVAGAVCAAGRL
jgi:hypothetical protein